MAHVLNHFTAVVETRTTGSIGNCFERAVALVMDLPNSSLVVGVLGQRPNHYYHAWVNYSDLIYDPVRFEDDDEELEFLEPEVFLGSNDARDMEELDREWVLAFANKGNLSDWLLKPGSRLGYPQGVGKALLGKLAMPYQVGRQGELLPP